MFPTQGSLTNTGGNGISSQSLRSLYWDATGITEKNFRAEHRQAKSPSLLTGREERQGWASGHLTTQADPRVTAVVVLNLLVAYQTFTLHIN